MNIDCQKKTITCDCGHTVQIQKAALYRCTDFQPYLFDCEHCPLELIVPIAFNTLLEGEILKNVKNPNQENGNKSDKFSDIFLGENQVPITDTLIEQLVKTGMKREDLLYMQKEGARYSTTRKSFLFPPEGDIDNLFE